MPVTKMGCAPSRGLKKGKWRVTIQCVQSMKICQSQYNPANVTVISIQCELIPIKMDNVDCALQIQDAIMSKGEGSW